MPGRSSKLSKSITVKVAEYVRKGLPLEQSFILVGINPRTGFEWMQRGNGDHPKRPKTKEHAQFAQAVKRALAEHELSCIENIIAASLPHEVTKVKRVIKPDGTVEETTTTKYERSWQASAWDLERKYPQRYGRVWRVERDSETNEPKIINLPVGGPWGDGEPDGISLARVRA